MPIYLMIFSIVLSAGLAFFFVQRDAKTFALSPPSPLIDMDRMYDTIFHQLDSTTGSALTPTDLGVILDGLIAYLLSVDLIQESIVDIPEKSSSTLEPKMIVEYIKQKNPTLDVQDNVLLRVIEHAIDYLGDIHAVS